ncbi:hypothetical protein BH23CHL9_BH23CHL9_00760 [soil metagenome]
MRQNWAEWAVLSVSVVAVAAVVGFLAFDGIANEERPPEPVVEIEADAAYETATSWIVPATVTNDGDETAEALLLRATATVAGETEESELMLDYLPAGTQVDISFGFSAEPDGEVTVRTIGFRLP